MDKKYFTPVELIKIATQHAYCAEDLLKDNAEISVARYGTSDTLLPVVSLLHMAFVLTLKAYLLHDHNKSNQYKNLMELVELSPGLELAQQDRQLLKNLARQYAFGKGVDYELWEDRQQLQVFCAELIKLYERIQQLMPLELQSDYLLA